MLLVSLLMLCALSGATTAAELSGESAAYVGRGRVKRLVQFIGNQATPHYPCIRPDGTNGRCRPVRECLKENMKSGIINFMDRLCVMNGTSVGACCPEEEKEPMEGLAGLAGSLPATAEIDEEDNIVLKIDRAENRGCGVSTRPRVQLPGSRIADPREWPWMASVTPDGFVQYCGGVLITDEHVLTAAHCTRRWQPEELFVRLGEYDMNRSNDSRAFNFKVVEKRQHEDFDITTYRHDVAILKLHRKAVFNTYIWPICLPPPGLKLTDEIAVITGWGTQHFGGPISNVLMEVSVPVWDHQVCVDSFTDTVFEENLCAGAREGGRDACQGDSGGPLMYQMASGRWTVIGIVSWGVRCGEANHPGIYASVDKYLPWIRNNVIF